MHQRWQWTARDLSEAPRRYHEGAQLEDPVLEVARFHRLGKGEDTSRRACWSKGNAGVHGSSLDRGRWVEGRKASRKGGGGGKGGGDAANKCIAPIIVSSSATAHKPAPAAGIKPEVHPYLATRPPCEGPRWQVALFNRSRDIERERARARARARSRERERERARERESTCARRARGSPSRSRKKLLLRSLLPGLCSQKRRQIEAVGSLAGLTTPLTWGVPGRLTTRPKCNRGGCGFSTSPPPSL